MQEEEELQTMDKQTLLGRFANRSDETNLNYVHIYTLFLFFFLGGGGGAEILGGFPFIPKSKHNKF